MFAGTIRINRMNNCLLLCEKDLRKGGTLVAMIIVLTHIQIPLGFGGTSIKLSLWYRHMCGIEPVHTVKRYDRKDKKYIQVDQPHIIKTCNKYMGGIDKLDMMCSFYKANLKCHRWYIYIWAHTTMIASVNAWFLYRRDLKLIKPNAKHMPLKSFKPRLRQV